MGTRAEAVALVVAVAVTLLAGGPSSGPLDPERASAAGPRHQVHHGGAKRAPRARLITRSTGHHAEIRETVPLTRRARAGRRVVMSLPLPRLRRHDRIRVSGEVGTSTTCVAESRRCIGRIYHFDPRVQARLVLASTRRGASPRKTTVSRRAGLSCGQGRPNRNHHCPLAIEGGLRVRKLGRLPCSPRRCRLNLVLSAHHPLARGGEVLVIGGDRPDGSVGGDKGRLSAAVIRAGGRQLKAANHASRVRRRTSLEPDFVGGRQVIYSQRVDNLKRGDVLIARARQRSALPGPFPYFISNQIVVTTKRYATRPTAAAKRSISSQGTMTENNGFNCTSGPSAFRSPCRSRKSGIVQIERAPKGALFVNLVSRTFPLIAQQARSRGDFPAVGILRGGGIAVQRLRLTARRSGSRDGRGGGSSGPPTASPSGSSGGNPLLPLPPLPIIGGS